jgi:HSP20 family protein
MIIIMILPVYIPLNSTINPGIIMKETNIYPGTYTPLPELEPFLQQLRTCHPAEGKCIPAIIKEIEGCYQLNLALPGLRREDLVVHAHGNTLTIAAIPRGNEMPRTNREENHIQLPADADTQFISATYKDGVLHLCIPRATSHPLVSELEVIIY